MKIRITGTSEELTLAKDYYTLLAQADYVNSLTISQFYKNRNSINQYRLYVEVEYKATITLKNLLNGGD